MKSVVNDTEPTKSEFPKLMQSHNGTIVLFYEQGKGVSVHTKDDDDPMGEHSDEWYMGFFKDYEGSVTLSNGD